MLRLVFQFIQLSFALLNISFPLLRISYLKSKTSKKTNIYLKRIKLPLAKIGQVNCRSVAAMFYIKTPNQLPLRLTPIEVCICCLSWLLTVNFVCKSVYKAIVREWRWERNLGKYLNKLRAMKRKSIRFGWLRSGESGDITWLHWDSCCCYYNESATKTETQDERWIMNQ